MLFTDALLKGFETKKRSKNRNTDDMTSISETISNLPSPPTPSYFIGIQYTSMDLFVSISGSVEYNFTCFCYRSDNDLQGERPFFSYNIFPFAEHKITFEIHLNVVRFRRKQSRTYIFIFSHRFHKTQNAQES